MCYSLSDIFFSILYASIMCSKEVMLHHKIAVPLDPYRCLKPRVHCEVTVYFIRYYHLNLYSVECGKQIQKRGMQEQSVVQEFVVIQSGRRLITAS